MSAGDKCGTARTRISANEEGNRTRFLGIHPVTVSDWEGGRHLANLDREELRVLQRNGLRRRMPEEQGSGLHFALFRIALGRGHEGKAEERLGRVYIIHFSAWDWQARRRVARRGRRGLRVGLRC